MNIQDNIICNRVTEGNKTYLLEAKRRGLDCGISGGENTYVASRYNKSVI